MKIPVSIAGVCVIALGLLFTGCGSGKTKMDTSELEQAFAGADAALKAPAEEAAKALRSEKYFEGATALVNLAKAAEKMSEPQKNAMINLGATIQLIMAENGDKADLKVYQAIEDMMAALDGREASKVGTDPDRVRPPKVDGQ